MTERATPSLTSLWDILREFSKKWMANLGPSFTTYLKPAGNEEEYLNAVDKAWSGALPFSALYHKGQRKKVWTGVIDLTKLKEDVDSLCR